jgi:hypothetical protein
MEIRLRIAFYKIGLGYFSGKAAKHLKCGSFLALLVAFAASFLDSTIPSCSCRANPK